MSVSWNQSKQKANNCRHLMRLLPAIHNGCRLSLSPISSLPAPERAILFCATEKDAAVKPGHDERRGHGEEWKR
jgi:hypothetical protein